MIFRSAALFLLLSGVTGNLDTKYCEMVATTECTKTCDGGWQIMRLVCADDAPKNCSCPYELQSFIKLIAAFCNQNTIYYQCNNRPCLEANATLLDIFYDEEDKAAEENEYEYYEEESEEN